MAIPPYPTIPRTSIALRDYQGISISVLKKLVIEKSSWIQQPTRAALGLRELVHVAYQQFSNSWESMQCAVKLSIHPIQLVSIDRQSVGFSPPHHHPHSVPQTCRLPGIQIGWLGKASKAQDLGFKSKVKSQMFRRIY